MGTRNTDGTYRVTPEEIEAFHRDGFVHLAGLLSEDEVAELEVVYDRFLRREIEVAGKDSATWPVTTAGTRPTSRSST